MARNGSGTYTVPNTFVAGTTITASDHNENWSDVASEMSNSVAADGQTPMAGALRLTNGSAVAPGVTFGSDADTGLYRRASNELGFTTGGIAAAYFDSAQKFWALGGVDIAGNASVTGTLGVTGAFTGTSATYTGLLTLSSTAHMQIPVGTTAQETAAGAAGKFRFNTTLGKLRIDTGAAYENVVTETLIGTQVPAGTVIQRGYAEYTAATFISSSITLDDTIPQNNEGDQIITTAFTPRYSNSRIYVRFEGCGASGGTATVIASIFNGSANAITSAAVRTAGADLMVHISCSYEYAPGSASAITFSVRAASTGSSFVFNGDTSNGRRLGGAMRATLIIEEIKV